MVSPRPGGQPTRYSRSEHRSLQRASSVSPDGLTMHELGFPVHLGTSPRVKVAPSDFDCRRPRHRPYYLALSEWKVPLSPHLSGSPEVAAFGSRRLPWVWLGRRGARGAR